MRKALEKPTSQLMAISESRMKMCRLLLTKRQNHSLGSRLHAIVKTLPRNGQMGNPHLLSKRTVAFLVWRPFLKLRNDRRWFLLVRNFHHLDHALRI